MQATLFKIEEILSEETSKLRSFFSRNLGFEAASDYLKGLLSKVNRKNSWQLAETLGEVTPYRFQHMLNRGGWDADKIRDHNASLVIERLGDSGIFVVDETGFLKKGIESAGVKRQYSGTAGRIENCQIGVFASYRTDIGHAFIDRELYIPKEWIDNPDRCKKARISTDKEFLTKPALATNMYIRFIQNGNKPSWVTADEAYGRDRKFKSNLEEHMQPYVLAVPKDERVLIQLRKLKAQQWYNKLSPDNWQCLSCGNGNKGKRLYNWTTLARTEICQSGFKRYLLIRQSLSDSEDIAFYTVFCKEDASLQEMVNIAGARWSVEECFKIAKGETGLDQYEVRTLTGWYRHITLSMLAFTILRISQGKLLVSTVKNGLVEFKKKRQK